MQDIAARVGVSRQLVSLVLRDDPGPSAASRERILAAAAELGYRVNTSARLLREGRTRRIGTIFAMDNPHQVRVVEELFVRAGAAGYGLALGPRTASRDAEAVIGDLMDERVDALLIFNAPDGSAALAEAAAHVPLVQLGEWARAPLGDVVHVDEADGLRQAVAHLVELGHSRISFIGGEGGVVGEDRARAYRDAMAAAGLEGTADVIRGAFTEEDGAAAGAKIIARLRKAAKPGRSKKPRKAAPTAVICVGDQVATGLLAVLARAGVEVPAQLSVVGFDDSRLAGLSYHRLTSVHQDVEAMVEAALECLMARLAQPGAPLRRIATPTRLVVRDSTGPVAG